MLQVGASNELPESEELDALYDRFLIRRRVNQVSSPFSNTLFCGPQLGIFDYIEPLLRRCIQEGALQERPLHPNVNNPYP